MLELLIGLAITQNYTCDLSAKSMNIDSAQAAITRVDEKANPSLFACSCHPADTQCIIDCLSNTPNLSFHGLQQ